ncbi:MAG: hypothetical protein JL50_00735 [Peptococcaceae bacterium BICA1-7]|nr:MAG: hypothetical protein JL50_00735 [Peptococcaceae bacterium BICA1-7]
MPAGIDGLPIYLPAAGDRFKKTPDAGALPWVVVNGARFFSSTGSGLRPSALAVVGDIKRWLNTLPETRVGIHFYVQDRFLEGLWKNRACSYKYLKQFDIVFSPNFSVYEDSPRYEHLINIRRCIRLYEEMLEFGIKAIPDVAWYQRKDLDWWADYITKNSIQVVAASTQTVGTGLHTLGSWKGYLAGIRYLAERIPGDVRIIIVGVSSPKKARVVLREIGSGGRDISFMNSQAFMKARKGKTFRADGRKEFVEGIDFDAFFLLNVSEFTKCYMDIKGEVTEDA